MILVHTAEKSIKKTLQKFEINQSSKGWEIVRIQKDLFEKTAFKDLLRKETDSDFYGQTAISKNNLNFKKSFCANTVGNKLWKYARKNKIQFWNFQDQNTP